jgi:hypothetical protein
MNSTKETRDKALVLEALDTCSTSATASPPSTTSHRATSGTGPDAADFSASWRRFPEPEIRTRPAANGDYVIFRAAFLATAGREPDQFAALGERESTSVCI